MTARSPDVACTVRGALARVAGGRFAALPLTFRFWDGSELAAPFPDAPVVRVTRRAIGHLLHEPNQLGLVRAMVTGELALERGTLEEVLALRVGLRGAKVTPGDLARLGLLAVRLGGRDALAPPHVPASELRPRGRLHGLGRDRTVVRHHYDVSNAFYAQLLGPSLVYSCAVFADEDEDLEAAQERKLERICRKLRLAPGERFLDLGCGWGSLVLHAARHHGVHAVGVTLSEEQAAVARERIRAAGLADRCEIRVADYRELRDDPFDKLASVGMYEHVGAAQLGAYATTMARLVRPGGLALHHGISRLHTPRAAGPKSLIQRFVFPDGELLPVGDVVGAVQGAGLEVRDLESLREHYGLTLRRWIANLEAGRDAAEAEVGLERVRVWLLYLWGSALAFEDGDITVVQLLLARRGAPHGLGLLRGDLAEAGDGVVV